MHCPVYRRVRLDLFRIRGGVIMGPLTIYLRREPTTDEMTRQCAERHHGGKLAAHERDVVAYEDPTGLTAKGRWPWHHSKPDRRNRYVMLNCYRWRAVWLPDLA